MRILHTGDWHIGKRVHGVSMIEDQKYMLEKLIEKIETENIDLVVIAGDLYDRSIPPVEAVQLLDETLAKIVLDLKVKVIAIAGNHDGADRLAFASKLLKDRGLYIYGHFEDPKNQLVPLSLEDDFGPIHFYPLPFSEPTVIRHLFKDDHILTYEDAMAKMIGSFKDDMNSSERHICIAHAFVAGSNPIETSDSERTLVSVGGSENISLAHFEEFDYVCLGHIHSPQKVGSDRIRYAGSLLKYSFSEANQKKSFTIIDFGPKGQVDISTFTIPPLRDMRRIEGELHALIDPEILNLVQVDDYIEVTLTDKGELYDPMQKIKSYYPNALSLIRKDNDASKHLSSLSLEDVKRKSPDQLFLDFYELVQGEKPESQIEEDFKALYQSVIKEIEEA